MPLRLGDGLTWFGILTPDISAARAALAVPGDGALPPEALDLGLLGGFEPRDVLLRCCFLGLLDPEVAAGRGG